MLKQLTSLEIAIPSDAFEIALLSKNDIEHGLGWKYTPEQVVRLIRDSSKNVVVARVESKLVGFGIMTYYAEQANLDLLAVKHNYRRMKIGSQIVLWLEKVAQTAGAYNVYVQVRSSNTQAIKFYQRLGFQLLDEHRGFYRGIEAGVIMAKNLRPMLHPS